MVVRLRICFLLGLLGLFFSHCGGKALSVSTAGGTGGSSGGASAVQCTSPTRPAIGPSVSLWTGVVPVYPAYSDPSSLNLGMKFQTSEAGTVSAIRFYRGQACSSAYFIYLFDASGTLWAQASASDPSPFSAGWQQIDFATPVPLIPNQTYIASYYCANGGYAVTPAGLDSAVSAGPLTALASGSAGGNGVYAVGPPGMVPVDTYNGNNYFVDVVFNPGDVNSVAMVTDVSVSPSNVYTPGTVFTFAVTTIVGNRPLTKVEYLDGSTVLCTATGCPWSCSWQSTPGSYSVVAKVYEDQASPQTSTSPSPLSLTINNYDYNAGPGGPIAVITNSSYSQFGTFYAEILRAEGLNEFTLLPLSETMNLAPYPIAILPETPLTSTEATLLSNWVAGGGVLIAMRPDPSLNALLGIGVSSGNLVDGYFMASGSTWGVDQAPMQFHGTADLHALLAGTTQVAQLYSNYSTASGYPAVTLRQSIGAGNGTAIAFMYDLARSVVLTRQGNPSLAGAIQLASPTRASEMFYHTGSSPNYLDTSEFSIPQADEQQWLLTGLINYAGGPQHPLPRFWYLPGGRKAAVMMTGDDHNIRGTSSLLATLSQPPYSPSGCSVSDWTCARASGWVYTQSMSTQDVDTYAGMGFEIGPHISLQVDGVACLAWTDATDLSIRMTNQQRAFVRAYGGPLAETNRTHCFVFADWDTEPRVERQLGIRLEENYTQYSPTWLVNVFGRLNGSGIPMRFAAGDMSLTDVYQVVSNFDYEYFPSANQDYTDYRAAFATILDDFTGSSGYWGVLGTHYDYSTASTPELQAMLDEISSRNQSAATTADQIAMVSAQQVLDWLDLRNGASFTNPSYNASTGILTFGVTLNTSVSNPDLEAMVPSSVGSKSITGITLSGSPVTIKRAMSVKGVTYSFFDAVTGTYSVQYQ